MKPEQKIKAIVGSLLAALLPAVAIAQDCGTYTTCQPDGPCITVPRPCNTSGSSDSSDSTSSSRPISPKAIVVSSIVLGAAAGAGAGSFNNDKNGQTLPMIQAGAQVGGGLMAVSALLIQGKKIPAVASLPVAALAGAAAGRGIGQWEKGLGQKDNTAKDTAIGAAVALFTDLFARTVSKALPSKLRVHALKGMSVAVTGRRAWLRWHW